jgi:Fur family peroxide stress response transcriptional regulator
LRCKIKRRKSLQREKIYELIKRSKNHPSAHWVYDTLRAQGQEVSIGNVYRNIKILVEEGRVVKREFNDGNEHYDAIIHLHYHFICDRCKQITDFNLPVQNSLNQLANDSFDHMVDRNTIQFYGICKKCKKK